MITFDETTLLLIAFFVLLVPFPLISFGTMRELSVVWWLGLVLLMFGGLLPPISRYVFGEEEDEG